MSEIGYVELHCHSYFSLLDGASSPEALVKRAAELGYPALALTDHNGLYGAVRFWQAAQERGLKPIVGAEVSLDDACPACPEHSPGSFVLQGDVLGATGRRAWPEGDRRSYHLTLLAETQRGYASLCRLISAGQLAGQKGHPLVTVETLAEHAHGLLCLSGCRQGAVSRALLARDEEAAHRAAAQLWDLFGPDRFWIEVQAHYLPTDARLVAALVSLARELEIDLVVTNNVHYAKRDGQRLHDVLTCVRHQVTLPEALGAGLLHPNSEQVLKPPSEMAALYSALPEALRNTLHIAERCEVSLNFAAQRLPAFPVPEGHTPGSYLHHLCEQGLRRRFNPVTPRARAQLAHELAVVERMGLAGYFLVVWDIVRFARSAASAARAVARLPTRWWPISWRSPRWIHCATTSSLSVF